MIVYILLFVGVFKEHKIEMMQSSLNRLYSIFSLTADILPSPSLWFLVVLKNYFWGY